MRLSKNVVRLSAAILSIALVFGMGNIVSAKEKCCEFKMINGGSFSLLGGVATKDAGTENFTDQFSFGGGALLNLSSHVGILAFGEYTDLTPQDRYDVSTYGAVTLFGAGPFKLCGLGGFEWTQNDLAKFRFVNPTVAFGALGQIGFNNTVGLYGTLTNSLPDGSELWDNMTARAGLSVTF